MGAFDDLIDEEPQEGGGAFDDLIDEPRAVDPDIADGDIQAQSSLHRAITNYFDLDAEAPSTDPAAFERAGERAMEAFPQSGGDIARTYLKSPFTPWGPMVTGVQNLAAHFADGDDGVATKVYEGLSGYEHLSEEELLDLISRGEIDPLEEAATRRRQAPLSPGNIASQAKEMGAAMIDIPAQATRGVIHMGEDVLEGRPGDALMRPATTAATLGAEMVRSAGRTSMGDVSGRELEAVLDMMAGGGAALKGGKALAAGRSVPRAAWEATKGFVTDDPDRIEGTRVAIKALSESNPVTSAMFPGRSREMLKDSRFEGAAQTTRDLDLANALPEEAVELAEAMATQGEELTPLAREQVRLRTEAEQMWSAAMADEDMARLANAATEGVPFDEILENPQATEMWKENLRNQQEAHQRNLELEEELATTYEGLTQSQARLEAEQRRFERIRINQEDRKARARDSLTIEENRARDRARQAAIKTAEGAIREGTKKGLDAWERAGDRLGTLGEEARQADAAFRAEDKMAHGGVRISRKPEIGFDQERKIPWNTRERSQFYKDGLADAEPRDFRDFGGVTLRDMEAMGKGAERFEGTAGLLDSVNEALNRRGLDRYIDPKAAWMELSKTARTVDDLDDAAALMRDVPGFENFDPLNPSTKMGQKVIDEANRQNMLREMELAEDLHQRPAHRFKEYRRRTRKARSIGRREGRARAAEREAWAPVKKAERRLKRIKSGGHVKTPLTQAQMRASRTIGRETALADKQIRLAKKRVTDAEKALREGYVKAGRTRKAIETNVAKRSVIPASKVDDPVLASAQALAKVDRTGGARLMLGDEVMNTPRAALLDLGRHDMRAAMESGDLRIVHPDADTAAMLNKTVLPAIVRVNEMGKQKYALNIPGVGAEQLRTQATNYMRAYYDASRARRWKIQQAQGRLAELYEDVAARVEAGELDEVRARKIMDTATEHEAGKIPNTTSKAMGRQFGVFGKMDTGSMKRARSKFHLSREEQQLRGRWDARRAQETLARMFIEQNRTITNHRLFRALRREPGMVLDTAPGGLAVHKEGVKIGAKGYLRETVDTYKVDGKTYALMPNSRERWGDLAGKLVDVTLAKRLTEANLMQASVWTKLLSVWKVNKVVNNFSSQFHVLVGNMINQTIDGGSPHAVAVAARKVRTDPLLKKAMRDAGLYEGQVLDVELGLIDRKRGFLNVVGEMYDDAKFYSRAEKTSDVLLEVAAQTTASDMGRLTAEAANWMTDNVFGFGGRMKRLFSAQEVASRAAIMDRFLRRQARKTKRSYADLVDDQAVLNKAREHVMDIQLDYGDLPVWAQYLRGTGLVPFISYPMKATGMFIRGAAARPMAAKVLPAGERTIYTLSPRDEQERRDRAPEHMAGSVVPITDDYDFNARYATPFTIFPFGEWGSGRAAETGQGLGRPIPAHLKPFMQALDNKDFYGRPIYNEIDPLMTQVRKGVMHVVKQWAPSLWSRAHDYVWPTIKGKGKGVDPRGNKLTTSVAVANTVGVRIRPKRPVASLVEGEWKISKAERAMLKRLERKGRENTLSPEDVEQQQHLMVQYMMRVLSDMSRRYY